MTASRSTLGAGLLFGLGLGGLFDGIVFHQLLQWHHLICEQHSCEVSTVAELRQQIVGDGLFHAACWVLVVAGMIVLARTDAATMAAMADRSLWRRRLPMAALAGWGIFNVAEGIINHQILGIHHVRPGPQENVWDMLFLAWGLAMLVIGWRFTRQPSNRPSFQTS